MKESLSAFVDGELSEHEQARVLAALAQDTELAETWERYHIIRAVLNRELGPIVSVALGDRVAQGIAQLPPPGATERRWHTVTRWAAQGALAASVAVLALVAIQWFEPGGSEESAPQVAIAPALQSDILHAGMRWDTGEPEVAHLLNTYLIEHNEFMPSSSIRGVMSYGRFVGYDSSPREQR